MPLVTTTPYTREYGLILNGTDQYGFHDVDLSNLLAVSIWVNPAVTIGTATAGQYVIAPDKIDDTGGLPYPYEGWTLGSGTAFIANETLVVGSTAGVAQEYRTGVQSFTFNAGTWYNLIINWTGSRYDVIIDDSIQSVTSGSSNGHTPQFTSPSMTVGTTRYESGAAETNFLNAKIANLILFDTALTGGQITTIYNGGPNGPTNISGNEIGTYKFDDGTGTTAADTSGSGNDLTLVNNPTWE